MPSIAPNVILLYAGNHADTQSGGSLYNAGWRRETTLDDKFIKSAGDSIGPNTAGGSHSHAHTGELHTHTPSDGHGHAASYNYTNAGGDDCGGTNTDPAPDINHKHDDSTITTRSGGNAADIKPYSSVTNNSQPAHYTFIYVKAVQGAVIQPNMIGFWNSATIPTGWNACTDGSNGAPALGDKYCKGALASANGGATGGGNTHTHDISHSHSTTHTHSGNTGNSNPNRNISNDGQSGSRKTTNHQHTVDLLTATVTTNTYSATYTSGTVEPAYKKLLAIQRTSAGATAKAGLIALWLGSTATIPNGWEYCDGRLWDDGVTQTPDMRDKHLKFANAVGEIGNTGGSNTHSHAASNSHTHTQAGAHSHTASVGYVNGGNSGNGGNNTPANNHNHTTSSVGNNNATLNWNASTMSAESVNNEPAYVTAAFIQLTKIGGGSIMLNLV